jgi:hypothetical protein
MVRLPLNYARANGTTLCTVPLHRDIILLDQDIRDLGGYYCAFDTPKPKVPPHENASSTEIPRSQVREFVSISPVKRNSDVTEAHGTTSWEGLIH